MVDAACTEFHLGAPLWLCALIIAHEVWSTMFDVAGSGPQTLTTADRYEKNAKDSSKYQAKASGDARGEPYRFVMNVATMMAQKWKSCGLVPPFGSGKDVEVFKAKTVNWVDYVRVLEPLPALILLKRGLEWCPHDVWHDTALQYNKGEQLPVPHVWWFPE